MQGFVNQSFERQMSTDSALNLLLQFQAILTRESLQVGSQSLGVLPAKSDLGESHGRTSQSFWQVYYPANESRSISHCLHQMAVSLMLWLLAQCPLPSN